MTPTSILNIRDEDIFLITTTADGWDSGMIATWIIQTSMATDRPRIVAVLSPASRTTELIEKSGKFVVHVLTEDQFPLVETFGLHSSRNVDKFKGLDVSRTSDSNIPIVNGTKGWIECRVVSKIDGGDRVIYLADVSGQSAVDATKPGLKVRAAFSRLPTEVVQAFSKKREADAARDNAIVRSEGR